MKVAFNEQMACQVRQHMEDVSAKQGRYVDLKAHPDRTAELPEAKEWPALGEFIAGVNRSKSFCTSGCMASGTTSGGHTAPYVDIYFDHPVVNRSPTAVRELAGVLQELSDLTTLPDFVMEMCNSGASLPDGQEIASLRLWLRGTRSDAEQAFPLILGRLSGQATVDYVPIAKQDADLIPERSHWWIIEFFGMLLAWIVFGVVCGYMASGHGWLFTIGGAIIGLVLFPVLLKVVVGIRRGVLG